MQWEKIYLFSWFRKGLIKPSLLPPVPAVSSQPGTNRSSVSLSDTFFKSFLSLQLYWAPENSWAQLGLFRGPPKDLTSKCLHKGIIKAKCSLAWVYCDQGDSHRQWVVVLKTKILRLAVFAATSHKWIPIVILTVWPRHQVRDLCGAEHPQQGWGAPAALTCATSQPPRQLLTPQLCNFM